MPLALCSLRVEAPRGAGRPRAECRAGGRVVPCCVVLCCRAVLCCAVLCCRAVPCRRAGLRRVRARGRQRAAAVCAEGEQLSFPRAAARVPALRQLSVPSAEFCFGQWLRLRTKAFWGVWIARLDK